MIQQPHFVYFLPWLGLHESITVGPITFWSYFDEAAQRIEDIRVKEYLDKLFNAFVDHRGNPVRSIAICSYENVGFRIFNETEYTSLQWAINALVLSSIIGPTKTSVISNSNHNAPPSANLFELRYQRFAPGFSNDMDYRAGNVSNFALQLGEFFFSMPWAIGGVFWKPERDLISAFNKSFSSILPNDVRERVFRSLEWFKLAHIEGGSENTYVETYLPKIVMMGTAFEILLDFPSGMRKADYFAEYIQTRFADDDSLEDNRTVNKQSTKLCLAACWAYDFYKLRNKVVHGSQVLPEDLRFKQGSWLTHLIVADLVFEECLKEILYKYKLIGENIRSFFERLGGSADPLSLSILDFDDIHKALGWLHPKAEAV
jgi:hypothetical protein